MKEQEKPLQQKQEEAFNHSFNACTGADAMRAGIKQIKTGDTNQ